MVYLNNCPLSRAVMQQGLEAVELDQMEWLCAYMKNKLLCLYCMVRKERSEGGQWSNLSNTDEHWWMFNTSLLHTPFLGGGRGRPTSLQVNTDSCIVGSSQGCFLEDSLTQRDLILSFFFLTLRVFDFVETGSLTFPNAKMLGCLWAGNRTGEILSGSTIWNKKMG